MRCLRTNFELFLSLTKLKKTFSSCFEFEKIEKYVFEIFLSLKTKLKTRCRAVFEFEKVRFFKFWGYFGFKTLLESLDGVGSKK